MARDPRRKAGALDIVRLSVAVHVEAARGFGKGGAQVLCMYQKLSPSLGSKALEPLKSIGAQVKLKLEKGRRERDELDLAKA